VWEQLPDKGVVLATLAEKAALRRPTGIAPSRGALYQFEAFQVEEEAKAGGSEMN
jgi:hypothetical protein